MIGLLAITFTALAALAGLPAWVVLPGATVLTALSIRDQRQIAATFDNAATVALLAMASWQSAGSALLASGSAYGLGVICRLALQS